MGQLYPVNHSDAGVVDENVQSAVLFLDEIAGLVDTVAIQHVHVQEFDIVKTLVVQGGFRRFASLIVSCCNNDTLALYPLIRRKQSIKPSSQTVEKEAESVPFTGQIDGALEFSTELAHNFQPNSLVSSGDLSKKKIPL